MIKSHHRAQAIPPRLSPLALALLLLLFGRAAAEQEAPAGGQSGVSLAVQHSQDGRFVPRYDVIEITFVMPDDLTVGDPFTEVDITVRFTGPEGQVKTVGGFFYDAGTWKARFAPDALGRWTYRYAISTHAGASAAGEGSFRCVPSESPGFVRGDPDNPFLWVFDNGDPYWPIGLQDCIGDHNHNGTVMDTWELDGGERHSPWTGHPTDVDTYLSTYAQAGFNLFRFSQQNCSYSLYSDLDEYLVQECMWTDELVWKLRDHGFRVFYGFIGYGQAFIGEPGNAAAMDKVKRFLKYSVDRWGAYVDLWELLNEQKAADEWTTMMADYVRSIDPYHHPITDWEAEKLAAIDYSSPHWYDLENEVESDSVTARYAKEWKALGKPVVVGEQGNDGGLNWDHRSAARMRYRCWSALFNEISFVFWNTSYALDGHYMNIYLGPEERQYIRALQNFAGQLDRGMKMVEVTVSDAPPVRAYGLASAERAAVYLRNASYRAVPEGASITLNVPRAGRGFWFDPETGRTLASFDVAAGRQTLRLPGFRFDLALLVSPERDPVGPPMPVLRANPRFGLAPQMVVFDAGESSGAFGRPIASYQWDFGDGTTAEGPAVSHTYPCGNYQATLTVTDAGGAEASASVMIRAAATLLENRPPAVTAEAEPVSGPAPLSVHFRARASDVDGIITGYSWDFGDGGTARTLDARHVYAAPGLYRATVTVRDDRDGVSQGSVTVEAEPPAG